MKKLLQINPACNMGSTGRIAEQIGLIAKENGWECYLVHGARHVNQSQLQTIQNVTSIEERIHAIETKIFDNHGLSSRRATRRLVKKIEQISPDIIHLHNIHGYFINYKILFEYLREKDIPVVWTLHDCWSFTGHCSYFSLQGCERWKTGCHHCPLKNAYPSSWLLDRSSKNYQQKEQSFRSVSNLTLVPVSDWLAELVKESFMKGANVHRIYNGVDVNVFQPTQNNAYAVREKYGIAPSTKILMGCAPGFGLRKGYKDFIKLSGLLESSYQIIMVGVTENQKPELEASGIIAVSRTESVEELALYYNSADIFLNLTYEDNFPTTNLEALACGTPVITYRTGGSIEAVDDHTGIIVEQGNIDGIVKAIEIIVNSNIDYTQELCRERATALYNKNDRFQEYLSLYEELIKK